MQRDFHVIKRQKTAYRWRDQWPCNPCKIFLVAYCETH